MSSPSAGNATLAQECVKKSQAPQISQTTMLSIAQQFQGYLPSSFFTDLVDYSAPLIANYTSNSQNLTQAELNSNLEKFFNNGSSYGAQYVTCISEVQQCVSVSYLVLRHLRSLTETLVPFQRSRTQS